METVTTILISVVSGVAVGIVLYFFQLKSRRDAVKVALVAEINLLLRQAQDYIAYLDRNDHEWLQEGQILHQAPIFTKSEANIFLSVLQNINLIGKREVSKVVRFYSHHEECEQLIEILFSRIGQSVDSQTPLDERTIYYTQKRKRRIVEGLRSLCKVTDGKVRKLSVLPADYSIPRTSDVAKEMGMEAPPLPTPRGLVDGEAEAQVKPAHGRRENV